MREGKSSRSVSIELPYAEDVKKQSSWIICYFTAKNVNNICGDKGNQINRGVLKSSPLYPRQKVTWLTDTWWNHQLQNLLNERVEDVKKSFDLQQKMNNKFVRRCRVWIVSDVDAFSIQHNNKKISRPITSITIFVKEQ